VSFFFPILYVSASRGRPNGQLANSQELEVQSWAGARSYDSCQRRFARFNSGVRIVLNRFPIRALDEKMIRNYELKQQRNQRNNPNHRPAT